MKFRRIENTCDAKSEDVVYLIYDNWDDYSYCTTFEAYYKSYINEELKKIGTVKIGCKSLHTKVKDNKSVNGYNSYSIKELIPTFSFDELQEDFFSLGQDINYYKKINEIFGDKNTDYYEALKDIGYNYERFNELYDNSESCLINSLMRSLHVSNIEQFNRISKGQAELTEYAFNFKYREEKININVIPNSLPTSNIHILIGRNGVGKTWLLHNILLNLIKNGDCHNMEFEKSNKYFISDEFSMGGTLNNFAGIVGVSFSIFDDALSVEIKDPLNREKKDIDDFRKAYRYIGLISKNQKDGKTKIKSVDDLSNEFIETLSKIKKGKNKVDTYLETCKHLNNDPMFRDNCFIEMLETYFNKEKENFISEYNNYENNNTLMDDKEIKKNFKRLSSGHMIIILSLTLLVESIHEKTIVLIDEPETHLHPPLLSTYIRTLSFLLLKKNAVAIIATHSPIVLQEVPKSCVNKIIRNVGEMHFENIMLETFATNTDSLTREVFGLEVIKSGFYKLLEKELEDNFEKTVEKFNWNIGSLGQVLIQSLINQKRSNDEED